MAVGMPEDKNVTSGMRMSSDIIVEIDGALALKDGIKFLRSKNNVILSGGKGPAGAIPPAYFRNVWFKKAGVKTAFDLSPFPNLLVLGAHVSKLGDSAEEVIELRVVPVTHASLSVQSDKHFHKLIRPVKPVSAEAIELSGHTQTEFDEANGLKDVLALFNDYLLGNGFTAENSSIVTDGSAIIQALWAECGEKKIQVPQILTTHIDVKDNWQCMLFRDKPADLSEMLESLKLEKKGGLLGDDLASLVIGLIPLRASFSRAQQRFLKQ